MNTIPKQTPCISCLASFQVALNNEGVDVDLLRDFLEEHIKLSAKHYDLVHLALSQRQRMLLQAKQHHAELFLRLLSRRVANRQRQPFDN